jgi:hypothetical protein
MQETIEQYTQRILGYVSTQDPMAVQTATPSKIEELIEGVSPDRLSKPPAPGKWSVTQILAHLADSEIVVGYRIRRILAAPGTTISAFDQDKWAEAGNYANRDPMMSLSLLRTLREANVSLLKSLSPEQRKNFGVHAERGQESIERITRLIAGHDINHLRQLEGIVARGMAGTART